MLKKLIWIILIVILGVFAVYYKAYYPGSQLQLKLSLRHAIAEPIERFFNTTGSSCGIWYTSTDHNTQTVQGLKNDSVLTCFQRAVQQCQNKKVLLVHDLGSTLSNSITYSTVRVLQQNDQNVCLIQNNYEQYNLAEPDGIPLNFTNTCTVLADPIYNSCEPQYIKEAKQQKENILQALNQQLQKE